MKNIYIYRWNTNDFPRGYLIPNEIGLYRSICLWVCDNTDVYILYIPSKRTYLKPSYNLVMKLNSVVIHIVNKIKDLSNEDAIDYLLNNGFEEIGKGTESTVYSRKGFEYVIKLQTWRSLKTVYYESAIYGIGEFKPTRVELYGHDINLYCVKGTYLRYDQIIEKPTSKTVKLNTKYDALVTKDSVKVGCQTFPISIIEDLVKAKEELA